VTATEESATREVEPAKVSPGVSELRKFRPDIEGLRAIAVVTVVLAHAGLVFTGGYIGVDVFFVISGFLITRQLADEMETKKRIYFAKFYARRFRRIIPAATVVIFATLLAAWKWLSPLRIKAITQDAIFSAISGVNWRFAEQGTDYFQSTAPPSPFQHYWSLAVEEQFYAVWPLLLVISASLVGRIVGRQRAVVISLLAVILVSFYLSVTVTNAAAPWAYFGSQTRAWELALGALIAVTARRWSRLPAVLAALATWLGMALILWAAWSFTNQTLYPGSLVAVPVIGAALLIVGGCAAPPWSAETLLRQWPMQFSGRISYSWYLWHWPVLLILPAAFHRNPSTTETGLAVAASFLLAVATYYIVERPFRRNIALVHYPQRGIMVGTALAAVSVFAAFIVGTVVAIPGGGAEPGPPVVALSPAAVVDSTKISTLPDNLAPPLERALRDQADLRNCFIDYLGTSPNTSPDCVFGDPKGTKTLVLLGDSHAAQWAGPVFAWGGKNHWKVWFVAKSSCQAGVYPNYVVPILHRVYTECNEWRQKAFDFIRGIKPEMVVIGSLSKGVTITQAGMTEATLTLRAAGARVLYIADNPYMDIDPPSCLAQHADDIQKCSVPRDAAALNAAPRLAEIEGAKAGGAQVWDPAPYLCADVCPSVIGNIGVYKDESHLTNTFTMSLLPQLGGVLTQVAGG
jgi:peptidoglycan/LPS O-acetylase OafA/YrhL